MEMDFQRNVEVSHLNITVTYFLFVTLVQGAEYLKCDPLFLQIGQKWTRRYLVVQTALDVLPHHETSLVR